MTVLTKKAKGVTAVDGLYRSVRKVIEEGRKVVSIAANAVLVRQNWSIGKLIVEDEQKGRRKAEYGKKTLEALSVRLMAEYGNGYDARNLRYMRSFYLSFPIWNAVRSELGWTHYRILMREDDPIAREWYMNECVAGGWSSRDLDRQVSTDAYHRRLAAANPDRRRKQKELPLTPLPENPKSLVPADFIKNPMMLEFLSLPQDVKIRETKLESAILSHLKDVLMELGRGFSFVARQKHMRSVSSFAMKPTRPSPVIRSCMTTRTCSPSSIRQSCLPTKSSAVKSRRRRNSIAFRYKSPNQRNRASCRRKDVHEENREYAIRYAVGRDDRRGI